MNGAIAIIAIIVLTSTGVGAAIRTRQPVKTAEPDDDKSA